MKHYRKTYLFLEEILYFMRGVSKNIKFDPLFETAFSAFFLLKKPFFESTAQVSNSIQTFYANHYLRDVLGCDSLPAPDVLYKYCLSNEFSKDLKKVALALNIYNVIEETVCFEDQPFLLYPKKCLSDFIMSLIDIPLVDNLYDISDLKHADNNLYSEIEEKGFCVVNDFLTKKSLSQLKNVTKMISESEIKNKTGYFYGESGTNQRIFNLISKHKIYVDLVTHPYILEVLDKVFDRNTLHEKFGLNSMTAHFVAPGAKAIPMHIDSVVPDPIPPWMIRFIAILALDDFTKENGATEFVPGSHKFLKRPTPEDVKKHPSVIAECKAGSLIFFDGAIWHRSSANITELPRMGLMLSYAASFFMELCGEEEYLSIIPQQTITNFSPKMKQMIGFHRAIKKGALDINQEIYDNKLNK
jgi:ectoine hydroxylase-related dioxygenase (phytanoyl-CoA dioxygenase family)